MSRLKGRRSTLSSADTNTYYQIETEGKTYCLVAFSVESSAGSGSDEKSESELEILLYSLDNAVTETLGKYGFYKAEDGRELLYLLYMDEAELTQWNTEKLETMTFIKDFFHNRLSTSIAIAISDTTNDFELISELYSDAMRALEYKSIIGYEGVILVEDCKQMLEDIYQNTQWISDLVGAVTRGNYSQIQEITNSIFIRRTQQEGSLPLSVFRIELNECMYNVLKTYSSVITDNSMRQALVGKIIDLMTSDDIANMKAVFLDALYFACDTIRRNSKGVTSSFINQVRQFINENYSDYNLNINLIADRFSKNPNYLSQVYYAQAGQGLLDTIHEVRIERAKELLQNSSFTIEQVAQAVGFCNPRTFRRIFLKRCGVNPSQYKTKKAT